MHSGPRTRQCAVHIDSLATEEDNLAYMLQCFNHATYQPTHVNMDLGA